MIEVEFSKTLSARTLLQLRDEILLDWEKQVREQIKTAKNLMHPVIIDTVPAFITNLAEALSEEHPRAVATESSTISQEHGSERARLTRYGPDQLIKEYLILRETILKHLRAKIELTDRDRFTIQESFDQALGEGMLSFFLVHNRIREQFVAGLSHDLRNPLGAAKMAADLILLTVSDGPSPHGWEDIKNLAQRIVANTKRADRLIQNLLDASVVQIGERIQLKIEQCEILVLIKESIGDFILAERQRLHVKGTSVWGFWDSEALRRTMENLLTNAIKYGGSGTTITIKTESVQGRLIVSVHNEGSHIPAEEQESLFQPFRRGQAAREGKAQGWGLGLALVRSVAEGHGGSIGVESSPEWGTTFILDIPIDARPFQNAPTTD